MQNAFLPYNLHEAIHFDEKMKLQKSEELNILCTG
jgi:hypothetical protein